MMNALILTTLPVAGVLASLQDQGHCVVPLNLGDSFRKYLEALDKALRRFPPTSLDEARTTWLPQAADLADHLALRAASAGENLLWDEVPNRFSQILVITEPLLPIDLLPCRGSLLGTESVIAHRDPGSAILTDLINASQSEDVPLRRIAHVCTYDPGSTSLHEMDVVPSTLRLDNTLAIEHYFFPAEEVATGLFQRRDLDILHFECHGTETSLQLDNPYGIPVDVRGLYDSHGPSVFFFLGCRAGASGRSVAATFVRKGAKGAVGSYCGFLSGGGSGEVSLSAYYDALYQGLVGGMTLGEAVRSGRRTAAPDRIYHCAWLLFGNPNLTYSTRRFGDRAPARRPRRSPGIR